MQRVADHYGFSLCGLLTCITVLYSLNEVALRMSGRYVVAENCRRRDLMDLPYMTSSVCAFMALSVF